MKNEKKTYGTVVIKGEDRILKFVDKPDDTCEYYLVDLSNKNKIYNLQITACGKYDKDSIFIGASKINNGTYELCTFEELDSRGYLSVEHKIIKKTHNKIENIADMPPFTRYVVNACIKDGKEIPLNKKEHGVKVSLIRNVNDTATSKKEISVSKATDLLRFFGLEFKFIFKKHLID